MKDQKVSLMTTKAGYLYAFACYLWWGLFPLFFAIFTPVSPLEVVPWRVGSAFIFCLAAVTITRKWRQIAAIVRSPKLMGWFTLSALLLYANWTIFLFAIVTGRVLETALGFFINPLVTIVIGVVVRREKLSRAQWVAVAIAAIGITVSAMAYGRVPWLALGIAFTFGLYGAVRKQVSEKIDALSGLTVETMIVFPVALAQILLLTAAGTSLTGFDHGMIVVLALLLSGPLTAIPLLFFGAANRRLPLTSLGFIQFLSPIISFLLGLIVFHEVMPAERWIGFIAVWVALVVLLVDISVSLRRNKRLAPGEPVSTNTGSLAAVSAP